MSAQDDRTVAMPVPPADDRRPHEPVEERFDDLLDERSDGRTEHVRTVEGDGTWTDAPPNGQGDPNLFTPAPVDQPVGSDRLDDGQFEAPPTDPADRPVAESQAAHVADPLSGNGSDAWDRLAGGFVDDPAEAVAQARRLVREAVEAVAPEHGPDGGATEDLRLAFRRLREVHRTLSTSGT